MYVFVYGSLKQGYWNHSYLKFSTFIGEAQINGYSLYNVNIFPGMIKSNNEQEIVHGELYKINFITLKLLDHLEKNGLLYIRKKLKVQLDNKEFYAYSYLYLPEIKRGVSRVRNNNWKPKR